MNTSAKFQKMKDIIRDLESVVMAFSGGVDSTFVTKVCYDVLKDKALAVTARSETYPSSEFEEAKKLAEQIGVRHLVIETKELEIDGFAHNPPNRCYYCKKELFEKLKEVAQREGFKNVVDGANSDDTGDFRPGLQAGKELGVHSPIKAAGLTKADVRDLSRELGLPTWDKPAYACLSSRFPYGDTITAEKVTMVGSAEDFLRSEGLRQFRVRHHDTIARIEASPDDFAHFIDPENRRRIIAKLKGIGYTYVTLDLEGYRTGSMNETLSPEEMALKP